MTELDKPLAPELQFNHLWRMIRAADDLKRAFFSGSNDDLLTAADAYESLRDQVRELEPPAYFGKE